MLGYTVLCMHHAFENHEFVPCRSFSPFFLNHYLEIIIKVGFYVGRIFIFFILTRKIVSHSCESIFMDPQCEIMDAP